MRGQTMILRSCEHGETCLGICSKAHTRSACTHAFSGSGELQSLGCPFTQLWCHTCWGLTSQMLTHCRAPAENTDLHGVRYLPAFDTKLWGACRGRLRCKARFYQIAASQLVCSESLAFKACACPSFATWGIAGQAPLRAQLRPPAQRRTLGAHLGALEACKSSFNRTFGPIFAEASCPEPGW